MTKHKRPDRPYAKFPLTAHASGQWKKRCGKTDHYFGRWHDPEHGQRWGTLERVDPTGRMWKAALAAYEDFTRERAEGHLLTAKSRDASVGLVARAYLTAEHDRLDAGDIKARTYENAREAMKLFLDTVGRDVRVRDIDDDPSLAVVRGYLAGLRERFAAWTFNRHVRAMRSMFRWATNPIDGVLDGPLRLYGALKMVGTRVRRREQREARAAEGGRRMPTVPELRALHDAAPPKLRACYLLAFFGAYGQGDCAELPRHLLQFDPPEHLGLPAGWALVHFPRPKSEIDRACVLPPLVVDALKAVLAERPDPATAELADRVFLTEEGLAACYDVVHRDAEGTVQKVTRVDNVKQWHALNRKRLRTCKACGVVRATLFARGAKKAACPTCQEPTTPLRRVRFYDVRHASITLTAGCDETARLLHEGHILPGVRPEYVEGVHSGHLLRVGQTLLEHWERNAVTPLIGGGGHGPAAAPPPPASGRPALPSPSRSRRPL
jgi:hypothetical protein